MTQERKHIPLIPLRGLTVFPNMIIHFDVGRDKSLKAIEAAMVKDEYVLLVTQKNTMQENPNHEEIYDIGTIVKIKQIVKQKPPIIKVLVEGIKRARVLEVANGQYLEAYIEEIEEKEAEDTPETEALMRSVGELFERYAGLNTKLSMEMVYSILGASSPLEIMDLIVANIPLEVTRKQEILECLEPAQRMYKVLEVLESEVEILELQKEIQGKVKDNICLLYTSDAADD